MRDNFTVCACGHTRRGHYGGSGRLRDAGTCKTRDCRCRTYAGQPLAETVAREQEQEIRS